MSIQGFGYDPSHNEPVKRIQPVVCCLFTKVSYRDTELCLLHAMLYLYDQLVHVELESCPDVLRSFCLDTE